MKNYREKLSEYEGVLSEWISEHQAYPALLRKTACSFAEHAVGPHPLIERVKNIMTSGRREEMGDLYNFARGEGRDLPDDDAAEAVADCAHPRAQTALWVVARAAVNAAATEAARSASSTEEWSSLFSKKKKDERAWQISRLY